MKKRRLNIMNIPSKVYPYRLPYMGSKQKYCLFNYDGDSTKETKKQNIFLIYLAVVHQCR